MIKFVDLRAQYLEIRGEIDAAIEAVIREAQFVGGPQVVAFEREFAEYQQSAHCVSVANATDGMEIALEALQLPAGAEVLVPANSFIASGEAVTRAGLRVVFVDVEPDTFTIDIEDAKRRLTPRTAAIVAVHLYGHPCNMGELLDLAAAHKLRLVEDCAQAHGARYRGRRVGAIGDVGVFSFFPGKNLGAYGDGGAITTNDGALANRCRMIANHGRTDKYNHEFEGRNSRLDALQAAILRVKLRHLDEWTDRRGTVAAEYLRGLRGIKGLALPLVRPEVDHSFHLFVVRHSRRDDLAARLNGKGIQTGIHYPIALPKLRAYEYVHQMHEPMIANRQDRLLLSLPMGEHLSVSATQEVIAEVRAFCESLASE